MKEVLPSPLCLFRKAELQRHMLEAFELKDGKTLSVLEFQWAHRFGSQTLPKLVQRETPFAYEAPSDEYVLNGHQGLDNMDEKDQEPLASNSTFGFPFLPKESHLKPKLEKKNKSLISDDLEELKESKNGDSTLESVREDIASPTCSMVAPPPRPSLNHLRRWLPDIEEKLPKAS